MKKIVVYVKKDNKSNMFEFTNLGQGHEKFNEIRMNGTFDYLELGIDKIDIDGTYKIIRTLYN